MGFAILWTCAACHSIKAAPDVMDDRPLLWCPKCHGNTPHFRAKIKPTKTPVTRVSPVVKRWLAVTDGTVTKP